jgi:hypothetical protein
MNADYLNRIIDTYVIRNKRPRLRELMASSKRYAQFLDELLHDPRNFDAACVDRLAADQRTVDAVLRRLRGLETGDTAYMVGDCRKYDDGATGPLRELLDDCVGSETDALVYCPSANAAYYEGHEGFGYLLRPPRR